MRDSETNKKYMKDYYKKNPEKFKKTPEQQAEHNRKRRERYAKDKQYREKLKQQAKEYWAKFPEKRKSGRIRSNYDMSMEDFKELMSLQNGMCAICGYSDTSDKNKFPLVDHCHQTGKVRGLLCMNCNQALGKFKDSTSNLTAAMAYLIRNKPLNLG